MEYIITIPLAGLAVWLFGGILTGIKVVSLQNEVYDLAEYIWAAVLMIFIIFGIFWIIRKINEGWE